MSAVRVLPALLCVACALGARSAPVVKDAVSEQTLAARKLQTPLEPPLCRAAVYAALDRSWPTQSRAPVLGRGATLAAAIEALCREGDGLQAAAVGDLYQRPPTGFSPSFEVRGAAVSFAPGFTPPPPPERATISVAVLPPLRPSSEPDPDAAAGP